MPLLLRFNNWVTRIPLWAYSFFLVVAVAVKSGFTFTPLGGDELLNFPVPPNTWSALSYGMRSLVLITGVEGDVAVGAIGLVTVLISLVLITLLASRVMDPLVARIFLALVIVGPIGMVLLNHIGRNDVFVILGATIIAMCGRKISVMFLGLFIMILGNPEQSAVAMFCLLVLSFVPSFRSWRRAAGIGFVVALVAFIPLSLFARSAGVKSRIEFLPDYFSSSFYPFTANLPLTFYAAFGATWIVLGWIFLQISVRSRILLTMGIVIIPFFVTMITVDQTRVTVGVTTLSIMVALREYLPKFVCQLKSFNFAPVLGAVLVVVLFLPVIEIWGTSGHARTPYLWIFTSIVPQIKSLLIG